MNLRLEQRVDSNTVKLTELEAANETLKAELTTAQAGSEAEKTAQTALAFEKETNAKLSLEIDSLRTQMEEAKGTQELASAALDRYEKANAAVRCDTFFFFFSV